MTQLCRTVLKTMLGDHADLRVQPHPGLLLSMGLDVFPEGEKAGEIKRKHIERLCRTTASDFYRDAFSRWKSLTQDVRRFAVLEARVQGRLYIGTTRDTPLETGITVHHTYGMPMIPGSSVKGLCRSQSDSIADKEVVEYLFGNDWGEKDEAAVISGGIVYHDAWWVPEGQPFVSEVVTVHHQEYYGSCGETPATDFDSPIPAPQIATQGKFYFVIEGPQAWAELARHLLRQALEHQGIGGKRSSGYGYLNVFLK